jgi:hypothetical protein
MQYLQFDKAVNTLTEVHFLYEALLRIIQKVLKSTLLDCKKLLKIAFNSQRQISIDVGKILIFRSR